MSAGSPLRGSSSGGDAAYMVVWARKPLLREDGRRRPRSKMHPDATRLTRARAELITAALNPALPYTPALTRAASVINLVRLNVAGARAGGAGRGAGARGTHRICNCHLSCPQGACSLASSPPRARAYCCARPSSARRAAPSAGCSTRTRTAMVGRARAAAAMLS